MEDHPVYSHKLVLLGESAVGKSSLVYRFAKNSFDDMKESTIGAAFITQFFDLDDGSKVKFEIWDTAGQERYRSLAPMYYRNSSCAIVVYDITQKSSLDRARIWINELQSQSDDLLIALVGNKLDLEAERQVDNTMIVDFQSQYDILHYETSAKTGQNVHTLFKDIATKLPKNTPIQSPSLEYGIDLTKNSTIASGCAC